jgi:hypothetical protein
MWLGFRYTLELISLNCSVSVFHSTVRSEGRCALRLQYVDLVVSIEVAVEVYGCFTVFLILKSKTESVQHV